MAWQDLAATERALTDALHSFDWPRASTIVTELVTRMRAEPEPLPLRSVVRILRRLRRKRQFGPIQLLAEQVIDEGRATGEVRRHYAQALIDENRLPRAKQELAAVLDGTPAPKDITEATGLLGRVYKQQYANAAIAKIAPEPAHLLAALEYYWKIYEPDRPKHYWHGINMVALLARAARDGVKTPVYDAPETIAGEILQALAAAEEEAELGAWQLATAIEAHVAVGDLAGAELRALEYASSFDADAFEVFSTRRQLLEVWQLDEPGDPTGDRLLPILDAALLRRQGGETRITPQEAGRRYEENYGSDRFNTVAWYQDGLERCRAIGRVLGPGGDGKGTGWLVNSADFFPGKPAQVLLLTNAHVIDDGGFQNALHSGDATVEFQMAGVCLKVGRQYWSKPEVDATFVELEGSLPDAEPLPIYSRKLRMLTPPSRAYIIGHPEGGDLKFSLQDSLMVGCTDEYLHYRTPTKGGSSGSPVFEASGWRVVALHHAAVEAIRANEGIPVTRIREATS